MGKLAMGILGGFSGTVGTVIGSVNKNGDDIIRVKSKKPRTSQTEAQINQRTKFGLVTQFMKPLNPILKVGFAGVTPVSMSPYNYACMLALNKAITGTAPDIELDYSMIRISEGSLAQVVKPTAQLVNGEVKFVWSNNSESSSGDITDQAILVVYNANNSQYSYSIGKTTREALGGTLALPNHEAGDQLQVFLFFKSASGTEVSTSQYLGTITISE
ncbi:MAG: DUF6266 family protein [Bacteroidota bacterium]|nr:DUF6266 family protein [Bacteroidota bacterium]